MKKFWHSKKFKMLKSILKIQFTKKPEESLFLGILVKKLAADCKVQNGYPVTTMDGDNGLIIKFYDRMWYPNKERWLDIKLDSGSYKHTRVNILYMWYIYLPATKQYYPLSHSCYKFVTPKDDYVVVPFRLTKRGYAMLSEDFKVEREYVAQLRKTKHGAKFINKLEEELKFKLIKL